MPAELYKGRTRSYELNSIRRARVSRVKKGKLRLNEVNEGKEMKISGFVI